MDAGYTSVKSRESTININANDFDGSATWYFEIVSQNVTDFDVTVTVVDQDETVCATIVLAAGTIGPTYYEGYRTRTSFTPTVYDDSGTYTLKVSVPEGEQLLGWNPDFFGSPLDGIYISTARIIVAQTSPTKTTMQIPLCGTYNSYSMIGYEGSASDGFPNNYPFDYPVGYYVYDASDSADPNINRSGNDYLNDGLSIWKYDSSELSTVSQVRFSAAVTPHMPRKGSKTRVIFASNPFQHFHYGLYSASGADVANDNGDPFLWVDENQVHTDVDSGKVYTPVPDSFVSWTSGVDPYPISYTVYPDFSGFSGSIRLAIGGELFIGVGTENQWEHWQTETLITLPADGHLVNASLTIQSTDSSHMTWTLTYYYAQDVSSDITVSLYDMTAGSIVSGSSLTWEEAAFGSIAMERKIVEISTASLVSGHSYRYGIDCEQVSQTAYNIGQFHDAHLLISVNPITNLTTWRRCLLSNPHSWDNWDYDWGTPPTQLNYNAPVLLSFGANDTLYFEVTTFPRTADHTASVLALAGDGTGNGTSEVTDSRLTAAADGNNAAPVWSRTSAITLTDGTEYGNRQTDYFGGSNSTWSTNGFIVTTYSTGGGGGSYESTTEWLTSSTGTGGSGAATNATLVYAEDLSTDELGRSVGGWYFDTYNPNVILHYGEEGRDWHQLDAGGADGTVYEMTGAADDSSTISCNVQTRADDLGDSRLRKLFGDISIDANTSDDSLSAYLGYDNNTSSSAANTLSTSARDLALVNPDSDDWVSARNILLDLQWSSTTQDLKLYSWSPRFTEEIAPLQAFSWQTSETTFSLPGFVYTGYLYLPHISTANLSLTFTVDGTEQTPISISNSSGAVSKDFVRLPVMKGKSWKLLITSTEQFRIGGRQVELLAKAWGTGGPWRKVTLFADNAPSEVAQ